jgi:aspartate/methionine/tyrosine aminotransferase
LRVGWIVEPDESRREQYLNAREYFSISNTTAGEFLAEVAVQHRETVLGRTSEVATANLRLLDRMMSDHQDRLDWVRPRGGMTAFVRLIDGADARDLCDAAVQDGVLLTPGDCFGMPDHFRLGFGACRQSFPEAMERLGRLLSGSRTDNVNTADANRLTWSGPITAGRSRRPGATPP